MDRIFPSKSRYAPLRSMLATLIRTAAFLAITLSAFGSDSDDLRGALFRGVGGVPSVRIVSDDELELTLEADGPRWACKYTREKDTLRVIVTVLGSPQVVYMTRVPEGLQREDGRILYDGPHFEAAALTATPPPPLPTITPRPGNRPVAISAPRPEYPYEAQRGKITGRGVVLLTIDSSSGAVTDARMLRSTGSPILDNAAVSAYRRWRFEPGTYSSKLEVPINFTLSGAEFLTTKIVTDPNQAAMQLTARKPASYGGGVCHRASVLRGIHIRGPAT